MIFRENRSRNGLGVGPRNRAATAIRGMTPTEQHLQNDLDGLRWVSDFGWLRPAELGDLLWPANLHARKQGERLARSWLDRGLVLDRRLPERSGRALVLSVSGARLLTCAGNEARSGKDIGETSGDSWRPPETWKHDLLASQVLVDLYQQGFDVSPEGVLRRTAGRLAKMPDGLAWRHGQVIWLEVEASRKTGHAMRQLANALCVVGGGSCVPVAGRRPTNLVVAYAVQRRDERGYCLDHRGRVTAAVAAAAKEDVPVTWAACHMRGVNVESIEYVDELIQADRASAVLKRLDAGGWKLDDCGYLLGHYGGERVTIGDDAGMFTWDVAGQRGCAATLSAAKRAAASVLAGL